jgi:hypothetical protein
VDKYVDGENASAAMSAVKPWGSDALVIESTEITKQNNRLHNGS